MTTNKVHDPENKNCLFNFYSHAHVGVSECKMCPCTCEKQQQAPEEKQFQAMCGIKIGESPDYRNKTMIPIACANVLPCHLHSPQEQSEWKVEVSPRIDYCSECKAEHGFDCPKYPQELIVVQAKVGNRGIVVTPTSVTGDEWEEEFELLLPQKATHKREGWTSVEVEEVGTHVVLPVEKIEEIKDFIRNLLSTQRTHIKQALREEILRKIVPSNYEHLPEHARAGAVLQDILHIINPNQTHPHHE